MSQAASFLVAPVNPAQEHSVQHALEKFGPDAIAFMLAHGIRICVLQRGERYDNASPQLKRLGVDVDGWPAPPAGLFVVVERTLYVRGLSPMTIVHELGHALDCALGKGVYVSTTRPEIREAFKNASAFVTPYAATGLDEYFAESVRAYLEVNEDKSFWPRVSKARLKRCDPAMYAIVERIFTQEVKGDV